MSENIVIYAGINSVGKLKKKAIEQEARRTIKDGSVSALFWKMFETHGSVKLKEELGLAAAGRSNRGARK